MFTTQRLLCAVSVATLCLSTACLSAGDVAAQDVAPSSSGVGSTPPSVTSDTPEPGSPPDNRVVPPAAPGNEIRLPDSQIGAAPDPRAAPLPDDWSKTDGMPPLVDPRPIPVFPMTRPNEGTGLDEEPSLIGPGLRR